MKLQTAPCECGRTFTRLDGGVIGRIDDVLIIRGVNVFPTQVEELMLRDPALAPHYQIEIARPGSLDEMTVLVERTPAAGSADGEAAGKRLAHLIKSLIGVSAEVKVLAPGGIERAASRLSVAYSLPAGMG